MDTSTQQLPQRTASMGAVACFARSGVPEINSLSELLQLMRANDGERGQAGDVPVPVRRVQSGETLFHESARAESIYFVRTGTFKTFRTAEDGYEQVLSFVGRAEVLGFDAVCAEWHPTGAVALEDSSVYVMLVRDLFSISERAPALSRAVHLAASSALTRQGELADVMAAVAAEVRLARFLVHLSHRMAACGQSPRRFNLRMSRRDIASYLGVAHETVSRSFSSLALWGLIRVNNREIEVLDMDSLKTFSCNTRRQVDEAARHSMARPAGLLRDTSALTA